MPTRKNKRIVLVSGPSGAGKGTLQSALSKLFVRRMDCQPILCHSRIPKAGEIHAIKYYFLPSALIRAMPRGQFVTGPVREAWLSVDLTQIEEILDRQGFFFTEAFHTQHDGLKKYADDNGYEFISIFLMPAPPTEVAAATRQRLCDRGTDSRQDIERRVKSVEEELASSRRYTIRIVNSGYNPVEWGEFAVRNGKHLTKIIKKRTDLGKNARCLVRTIASYILGRKQPPDPPMSADDYFVIQTGK